MFIDHALIVIIGLPLGAQCLTLLGVIFMPITGNLAAFVGVCEFPCLRPSLILGAITAVTSLVALAVFFSKLLVSLINSSAYLLGISLSIGFGLRQYERLALTFVDFVVGGFTRPCLRATVVWHGGILQGDRRVGRWSGHALPGHFNLATQESTVNL